MTHSASLESVLHITAQGLLIPTMAVLILLIAFTVFVLGGTLAEMVTERRRLNERLPELITTINHASLDEVANVVARSGILKRQKAVLVELVRYRNLPPEALVALAKRLIATEDMRYQRIVGRTDFASRISPMLGLMGTLIPLGPGIVGPGER
jgi:biopolymer transport protein ExbB/TolQ